MSSLQSYYGLSSQRGDGMDLSTLMSLYNKGSSQGIGSEILPNSSSPPWQYTKHWQRQRGDQRISSLVPYAMAESGGRSPGWPFLPDSIKMIKSFLPRPIFRYAFEFGHRLRERWDLHVVELQVDLQPWVLHLSVARWSAQTCAGSYDESCFDWVLVNVAAQ